ncbi:hypothetical protein [Archangium sp.]|uniref:hypothetical protein n=1 Tax=Archangium sp. TaxID=1872627 RepID=UPI002D737651|nr:hypothetical protein [Archangium sp.]HYO53134.1 hypothetical protein [Archangium sp.]
MLAHVHGRKLRITLAGIGMAAIGAVGLYEAVKVTPAHALTRRTVCAQDLYVRTAPLGAWMGTLYRGQSFDVDHYSSDGAWVYGFAYGNVNRWGWVQNGWFC